MSDLYPSSAGEFLFTNTEREQSQLPAVALLVKIGYRYLSREEALELRDGKTSRVLLEDVLRAQLQKINRIRYKGQEVPFSGANLKRAVQALDDVLLVEGLGRANEQVYDLLRLGKSLEQTIAGDTKSFSLRYIDWSNPENNVFHVTPEYTLLRATGKACRLDLVLFVNGIPFAVIECKARDVDLEDAIKDMIGYQRPDYVPELFKYVQLVFATNGREAKYGTVGTEERFWAVWKSDDPERTDAEIEEILRRPLPALEREAVMGNFVREERHFYTVEGEGRLVTEQDRALYGLCRPERLLELVEQFIIVEAGEKKIARYQQYDAVKSAMARIHSAFRDQARPGGVIWHTQGSGKTLTMVMLANALAMAPEIENPRIILVTDRVDLDKQISDTFHRCGLEPKRATTGADLRRLVLSPRSNVITTVIHKFEAALAQGDLADPSPNIFVLVDESHRTQYGEFHQKMRKVFPNACYIGFTGTPLTRREKSTVEKFGGLIDTCTMDQAVEDKAIVPLLYERRHVEQEVLEGAIDTWFERICQGLSDEQRVDLKKKFSRSQVLNRAEQRLKVIAYDAAEHYRANWQTPDGHYKAQLIAPDKKSAIQLHRYMEDLSEVSPVRSAVVISPPDMREGDEDGDETSQEIVRQFWQTEVLDRYGSFERYRDSITESFKGPDGPEILIVVDMLITGFDVPRNTVLYLARRLTHHTLLQAIARVNRLYDGKDYGYIIDYSGVLQELDRALTEYAALAEYDEADLQGMMENIRVEVDRLPQFHAQLLDFFRSLSNRNDVEACEQYLADEERRDAFYAILNDFARSLRVALSTERFYEVTSPEEVSYYKKDLLRFQKLRSSVQNRYAEVMDMGKLEPQILKLLNTYVISDGVQIITPKPLNILDREEVEAFLAGEGTPASKADSIASATERTITERMDSDPAFYRKFSEMVRETIQAFRDHLLTEMDYLRRITELWNQIESRSNSNVPARLIGKDFAGALYRIVLEKMKEIAKDPSDQEVAVDVALMMEEAIKDLAEVVDWQKKPDIQNQIQSRIDDGFFELSKQGRIDLNWSVMDELSHEALRVAKTRLA